MSALALLRSDLAALRGSRPDRPGPDAPGVWLDANESPWASAADRRGTLRRYPADDDQRLRAALATLSKAAADQILPTRGSNEAIDLLVRAACRPGGDAVLVAPPTFGMYAFCARLHGAGLVEVPPGGGDDDRSAAIEAAARRAPVRLVFLGSPGNPGGELIPLAVLDALAARLADRALVAVDEAYIEFAGSASAVTLLAARSNLVVLRTLSKAHALAAARVGWLVAEPALVAALRGLQQPYPLPEPCAALARRAARPASRAATAARVAAVVAAREALAAELAALPAVLRVHPSRTNFLLARFARPERALDRLRAGGFRVRDVRDQPGLADALRITVGTPEQNAGLLARLREGT